MSVYVCDKKVNEIKQIQSNKPFVLVIHSHWCGACHNFAPNYNTFHQQQKLQNQHDQVISIEIDSLTNDYDTIYIKDHYGENQDLKTIIHGFPTILGIDKNNHYTVYEGNRDPADLKLFLDSLEPSTINNKHVLAKNNTNQGKSKKRISKATSKSFKPKSKSKSTLTKTKSKSKSTLTKTKSKSKSTLTKSKSKSKSTLTKSKSKYKKNTNI